MNKFTEMTWTEIEQFEYLENRHADTKRHLLDYTPANGYRFKNVGGLKRSFNNLCNGADGKSYEVFYAKDADNELMAIWR